VSAIVTASTPELRDRLVGALQAAALPIATLAADRGSVRAALRGVTDDAWLAIGGDSRSVGDFVPLALEAHRPWLAFVEPTDQLGPSLPWARGGGLLTVTVSATALRAALCAAREGLVVLAPMHYSHPASQEAGLSPREREVLAAAADGLSTKEIARLLELSPNTVKFHLQAAFEKLGAASRTEAVVRAIRRGELSV
jgi:DNA-binding CsgD family transcriptional regulator